MQTQLATAVNNMPETQRTLAEVQAAAAGLDEAIESLEAIAQHPQTPYPKHDVEQRANMGRTIRRQLDRSIQAQKEYEEKNAERLQASKLKREEELKKREEAKQAAEEAERQRKQKIAEERQRIAERDRELAEARAEEDRAREAAEMTTDSETGEKIKRKKKPRSGGAGGKRKKKNEDGITDDEDSGVEPKRKSRAKSVGSGSDDEKPKKKRRLAKKASEKPSKYKSSEIVVESDSEGDDGAADAAKEMDADVFGDDDGPAPNMDLDGGSEDEAVASAPIKRKNRRAMIEESDEEDEDTAPPVLKEDSPGTANGDVVDTPMADSDDE